MEERNEFVEQDGLFFESDTHEWFNDNSFTKYARKNSVLWVSGEQEDSLDVRCFIIRSKATGEYDRVMMDVPSNEIIYSTKSLEQLGSKIDQLKVIKRFASKK
jgi:hypothetical protein